MGETTGIAWTDHTFNPWRGCTRVSPGCLHCYAETMSGRNPKTLGVWGPRGLRAPAAESYWRQPLKWNRDAIEAGGVRRRVFCASLADVFEGDDTMPEDSRPVVAAARERLWALIDSTPGLDWLLLTKRPENIARMLPPGWLTAPRQNVWLGTSAEDQQRADERIPLLLQTPAAVRFVSYEPSLGPVDFRGKDPQDSALDAYEGDPKLDWIIVGGESGPNARPFDIAWARSTVEQCAAAGVACFVKQMGRRIHGWPANFRVDRYILDGGAEWVPPIIGWDRGRFECDNADRIVGFTTFNRAGADPLEWPEDLRVQQFPERAA